MRDFAKGTLQTRDRILPQRRSRYGSDFDGCLQLGWRSAIRALKVRGIAPHRVAFQSFIGNEPITCSPHIELA